MPPGTPNIASCFSIWTKQLLVSGALPKATIRIKSIGSSPRVIANGNANGGLDWVCLLANESIKADDQLVVQQELAGQMSDWTPDEMAYLPTPVPTSITDLRPVEIRSRLWECGEFIFLKGAEPGAVIEFSYGNAKPVTADAPDGMARIHLDGKLMKINSVSVRQITPIGISPQSSTTTAKVEPLPYPQNIPLPAPTLRGTPRACETAIMVQDVYDGATVTLKRNPGTNESIGFDLSTLIFCLQEPFEKEEYVSAYQTMQKCERLGDECGAIKVGDPEALQPGVGCLCVGGPTVTIYNLQPGGIIHFNVNGTPYDIMPSPGQTSHSFYLKLPPGTVTITQEICGLISPPTVSQIEECDLITTQPVLGKLYDCARQVRVTNIHVGAEVQIFTEMPTGGKGPISIRKVCLSDTEDFDVSPHLKINNFVWAVEIGPQNSRVESAHVRVDQHPPIIKPEIVGKADVGGKLEAGATTVTVTGVIPTASVYVYLLEKGAKDWTIFGFKQYAEESETTIRLDHAVKTGDQLAATQSYCAVITEMGNPVTVVKPRPVAPVIKLPKPGSTEVAYKSLSISWVDPGAGKEEAADTFDLEVYDGYNLIASQTGLKTTSFIVPSLKAGTTHTVKVRGMNSTGYGPWGKGTFTTNAPKPNIKYDGQMLTGDTFPPSIEVTVHIALEIKGTINLGDMPVTNDSRVKDIAVTSGSDEKLSVSLSLIDVLEPYIFLAPSGPTSIYVSCAGPLKGEWVKITASYNTPNAGKKVSNEVSYQWQKDSQCS